MSCTASRNLTAQLDAQLAALSELLARLFARHAYLPFSYMIRILELHSAAYQLCNSRVVYSGLRWTVRSRRHDPWRRNVCTATNKIRFAVFPVRSSSVHYPCTARVAVRVMWACFFKTNSLV